MCDLGAPFLRLKELKNQKTTESPCVKVFFIGTVVQIKVLFIMLIIFTQQLAYVMQHILRPNN